jgi:hypothetical protein
MILMALSAAPAEARYLYLSCTTRAADSWTLPGDRPYTFVVTIDLDRRAIVDVGGEGGWVVDSFSERYFSAHADQDNEPETLKIDRVTGGVELDMQLFPTGAVSNNPTSHNIGSCRETPPKF